MLNSAFFTVAYITGYKMTRKAPRMPTEHQAEQFNETFSGSATFVCLIPGCDYSIQTGTGALVDNLLLPDKMGFRSRDEVALHYAECHSVGHSAEQIEEEVWRGGLLGLPKNMLRANYRPSGEDGDRELVNAPLLRLSDRYPNISTERILNSNLKGKCL